MSDMKLQAKLKAIQMMRDAADGEMKNRIKNGIKKVSVMSDSSEGLKAGLDKAKELTSKPDLMSHLAEAAGNDSEESPDEMEDSEMPKHDEASEEETPEEEAGESKIDEIVEEVDPSEIEELIKKLQEKQIQAKK